MGIHQITNKEVYPSSYNNRFNNRGGSGFNSNRGRFNQSNDNRLNRSFSGSSGSNADSRLNTSDSSLHHNRNKFGQKSQAPKTEIKSDKTLVDYPSDDDDDEDEDRLKIHEDPSTEEKSQEGKGNKKYLTKMCEQIQKLLNTGYLL